MLDRLVLIFMIDALGYEQAGRGEFLSCLGRERRPVRSVLGYSSSAIPTIMSGLLPEEHGHLSMYRRAREDGVFRSVAPWLRLATRLTRRRYRLQRWVASRLRRQGITGYYSLYDIPLELLPEFDLCQRRSLYAPDAFPGAEGLGDYLRDRERTRVWSWETPEAEAFAGLEEELRRGDRRVLFLYTSDLDALMRATGPASGATAERLRFYEARIVEAIERARTRYREVRVFVFGDHGMAPVTSSRDLLGALREAKLRCPEDVLWFIDSTMARFWFRHPAAREATLRVLRTLGYGSVLSDEELAALGARFPGHDYGELIFLLHEGEIIVPSFMSSRPVRGMHGYHPDDRHSSTVLLTNVAEAAYPANLVDLHHLLRAEIAGALA